MRQPQVRRLRLQSLARRTTEANSNGMRYFQESSRYLEADFGWYVIELTDSNGLYCGIVHRSNPILNAFLCFHVPFCTHLTCNAALSTAALILVKAVVPGLPIYLTLNNNLPIEPVTQCQSCLSCIFLTLIPSTVFRLTPSCSADQIHQAILLLPHLSIFTLTFLLLLRLQVPSSSEPISESP